MVLRFVFVTSLTVVSGIGGQPAFAQENSGAENSPEVQAERRLDVFNYQIVGNTALPQRTIERAVMPFLGPQQSVSNIQAAREALLSAYREAGYEAVEVIIPEQDVSDGEIRFKVLEYKVGRLRVEGSKHHPIEDIKRDIPALAPGVVPNYNELAGQIAGLNTSADKIVTPSLRAGAVPGTVDVDLFVEDNLPLHGSLELNDRSSATTERLRLSGSLGYNNLFQAGHSLNLQAQYVPDAPEESFVASASYAVPLKSRPITLVGYAVYTDSEVAAVSGINVFGRGKIFGARGVYSFPVKSGEGAPTVRQVTLGVDYKDFEEDLVVEDNEGKTPISYVPFSASYAQVQRDIQHEYNIDLGVSFGVRGLGADNKEFRLKRFRADANWIKLVGGFGYTYKFKNDWRFGGNARFQYAGVPLISNEQFSAGGADSVRGYFEGQYAGDDGVSASLEVKTPNLQEYLGSWANEIRFLAFTDHASLTTHQLLAGQEGSRNIHSVGLGFNARLLDHLDASLTVARPQIGREKALEGINELDGDARVHFSLKSFF